MVKRQDINSSQILSSLKWSKDKMSIGNSLNPIIFFLLLSHAAGDIHFTLIFLFNINSFMKILVNPFKSTSVNYHFQFIPWSRPHICHRYHRLYPWRKICLVEKFHISAKNFNNLLSFIKIYAVFVLNLCGENLCGEKMTNIRSAVTSSSMYGNGVQGIIQFESKNTAIIWMLH